MSFAHGQLRVSLQDHDRLHRFQIATCIFERDALARREPVDVLEYCFHRTELLEQRNGALRPNPAYARQAVGRVAAQDCELRIKARRNTVLLRHFLLSELLELAYSANRKQ